MRPWHLLLVPAVVLLPLDGSACATCFGETDSPLAAGMTWGIIAMIGVAYGVLFSIIGFFIFLIRRASRLAARPVEGAGSR